jgi:hypothetical protein
LAKRTIPVDISIAMSRLRLPLIVLVLLLHTLPQLRLPADFIGAAMLLWLLEAIARTAVPLFCFMSAYLFFTRYQHNFSGYKTQLRQKCLQLGLPLLVWNLLVWSAGLAVIQLGYGSLIQHPEQYATMAIGDWLAMMVGIGRNPLVYPLWFIRDLLLLFCISPLFFLCWRISGWLAVAVFTSLFLAGWWPWFQPAQVSTLFFAIGAFAALGQANLRLSKRNLALLGFACVVYAGCHGSFLFVGSSSLFGLPSLLESELMLSVAGKLFLMALVLLLWNIALYASWWPFASIDLPSLPSSTKQQLQTPQLIAATTSSHHLVSQATFFVFAAHEPLLTLLAKMWHRFVGPSYADLSLLLWPLILTWLLWQLYSRWVRLMPTLSLLLVGRR